MIDGGFASTVANSTVSKSVLTNEVWTSEKMEEGLQAFCLLLSFGYCLSPCLPVEGERGAVYIYLE
jgi:hypothetical protein